jgi:hypothetical protein
MPTNNDFISFRDDLKTVYVDEDDFIDSNIKDMELGTETRKSMTIDYWFRKLFFRSTIAEEVLHSPAYNESLEAVDVRLSSG